MAKKQNALVKIEEDVDTFLDEVRPLKIVDQTTFKLAAEKLEGVLIRIKMIKDFWGPKIQKAFEVKQKANEALKDLKVDQEESLEKLVNAERWLKDQRQKFKKVQDEKDAKEKKRLEDIAAKKAVKEQEKLLTKATKTDSPELQEKYVEDADDVVKAPVFTPKTIKKSERTSTGTLNTWVSTIEIEVTDIKKLCEAIGKGELPINCVKVQEAKLKNHVKSFGIKSGVYIGYSVSIEDKERVTVGK